MGEEDRVQMLALGRKGTMGSTEKPQQVVAPVTEAFQDLSELLIKV